MDEVPVNLRDLKAIEARLELGFTEISADLKAIQARQDISNGRVHKLELRSERISGALAALGFILGLPAIIGSALGIVLIIRGW